MGQVLTLPLELPDRAGSFKALVNQMPVGLVWLDQHGGIVTTNEAAETWLESSHGEQLKATLLRMHETLRSHGGLVQATFDLSGAERLHITYGPDREPGQFMAVLDRQRLEKAKAEANVLRAVLRAIAHSSSRKDAALRALESVRGLVPFEHLAFFEVDPTCSHFSCTASVGVSEVELVRLGTVPVEATDSLLSLAWTHRRVVNVRDLSLAPGPVPFETRPGVSAVFLPVAGKRTWGVLYAAAEPEVMTESALGLLQSLADALGAVLELAMLEGEAARAREIAAQRDRLATIGQLVAGVAHEINNPLAFLKSNLNSLGADLEDYRAAPNQELWKDIEDIVSESMQGVQRIEQLVQALKGTARQRNEKIRFDPGRAVTEAVTIFRGARKSECDLECHVAALPEVLGSPSALGQVVLNLLQNGLDSMLALERKRRKLEVTARADTEQVILSFRDHGTGIPLAVQTRMFDAFYTTKDPGKGTGLGLYICHELVTSMGGRVEYTTGSEGTCFDLGAAAGLRRSGPAHDAADGLSATAWPGGWAHRPGPAPAPARRASPAWPGTRPCPRRGRLPGLRASPTPSAPGWARAPGRRPGPAPRASPGSRPSPACDSPSARSGSRASAAGPALRARSSRSRRPAPASPPSRGPRAG